jgi:signal transduction histidine kinase
VIPAESYSAADSDEKRLIAVTQLQHKTQAHAAKIRNVAALTRELRSRLEPIRNSLELIESNSGDGASQSEARGAIRCQVDHLTQLADRLLEVSAGNSEKIDLG